MTPDCLTEKKSWFGWSLTAICLTYLFFQIFYNIYAQWSVDDFWFAHRIYEFKNGLPYRDFSPYKTVLGYYLLLPTMLFGHDALTPLLYTKQFIALLNTILFALAALQLTRLFSKPAVLLSLALLISTFFVLSYSTNIRVDLLGYWLCLFSVLFLLEKKYFQAGMLIGIGFLFSQKVIWYIAASDIALFVYWLSLARDKTIFWGTVLFNLSLLIPIVIYIAIWAKIAGLTLVLHNIFYEAYIMFQLDSYDSSRYFFWFYTLTRNVFVFLLWPACFMMLFNKDFDWNKRVFIITYAAVIMGCLIPYKQVFPYYMLTTLPAFLLLYAAFFEWVYSILKNPVVVNKVTMWVFFFCYSILLVYIYKTFLLPFYSLFILLLPLLISIKLTLTLSSTFDLIMMPLIVILTICMGILSPMTILIKDIPYISRGYQKSMVKLTENLVEESGDYLAGIELIYNKNQPIPGLRHLDVPALSYLYQPTKKLASAMLASLYHTPDITSEKAIEYLKLSAVKFYVNNYRINALPPNIKYYLARHYQHFWGSIYLYSPCINKGIQAIDIKFSGEYKVSSATAVKMDGHSIQHNTIIRIAQGNHISIATNNYRLTLQETHLKTILDPHYKEDQWLRMI